MYKNIIFFLAFSLFCLSLYSQDWNEIYYLEDEAQYLIEEKQYDKAIDIYRRMIREVPEHSYAKYNIGLLYLKTDDQKNLAIGYLEDASKNVALDFDEKSLREIRTPVDVWLYLGEAYQIANRIDDAIEAYNNFKNQAPTDNLLYPIVNHRLQTCQNAKNAISNPLRVTKTNLGEPLNSDESNFGAVFSGDGNSVVFTSYTRNYLDNFYAVKENGAWGTPKRISEKLSSKFYLKTVGLSYDGSILLMATDEAERNDLFICYKDGRNWIEAEKLDKTINGKKTNETHACISKDGNTIYFTSDREGGLGGLDIYKSTKDAKGNWGVAENLGPAINTPYDETTPALTLDGKYLFFSSQGHSSIGGFDIFYIGLDTKSMAINLGYPANTTGDDLSFVPDNSLTSGYISMYDNTSVGKKDIYYISIMQKINLAGNLNTPDGAPIAGTNIDISFIESSTNEAIETINTNNGKFQIEVNPGEYTILINNQNYEAFSAQVNIPENYSQSTFSYDATLNPIEVEPEVLVAEVVEEINEEPVAENPEPEPEKDVIEELPKEEEKVPEPAEEVQEEIIIEERPVEKEIVMYTPKTNIVASGVKTYSIQLMALKNPVKVDYFEDVQNVVLTQYPDGFYRYTVGNTESYNEAQKIKAEIHKLGYTDSFIRINDHSKSTYTIQIMALIIPVKPDYFKDLSAVVVTKGADDYFRYTVGDYATYQEAKSELAKIKSIGYTNAYVKKSNN